MRTQDTRPQAPREAFGVRLSEEAIGDADTPRQLLEHIQARRSPGGSPTPQRAATSAADRAALLPSEPPVAAPVDAAKLVEVLEYHMRHQPDRVHVVLQDDDDSAEPITYRALHQASMAMAQSLRERGLEPGRSVAIMLPTGLAYLASFMGTASWSPITIWVACYDPAS